MKIPEGWPTSGMLQAGFAAYHEAMQSPKHDEFDAMAATFKAMWAAAPTPPAQNTEAIADTDIVSAALGNFAAEPTGDNGLVVVRAVMDAMQVQEAEPHVLSKMYLEVARERDKLKKAAMAAFDLINREGRYSGAPGKNQDCEYVSGLLLAALEKKS